MLANMLVTSICPAPSFATASTISHFLLEMYILVIIIIIILLPLLFRRATPPTVFVTEP